MKLPNIFKPKFNYDLIRIGSKHDGGYLIEKSSMQKAQFLFSFGVSTNWEFEKEFINETNINFVAFDGSVDKQFWENEKKLAIIKLKKLSFSKFLRYFFIKRSFYKFFRNRKLISKFIGNNSGNYITFNEALSFSKVNNDLFFKIDIEGSEYDILEDILANQKKLIGLAIEFHQCNKYINVIKSFVSRFKLELVHIHANNYDDLTSFSIPESIEITFAKNPKKIGDFKKLPHHLDRPNRSKNKEIELNFE
tara:strand:+ start:107 stop:856 length:750 start_codon:yes stop_codon:yes gene_type:complete